MATKKADKESGTPSAKPDAAPKATKRALKSNNVAQEHNKVRGKPVLDKRIVKAGLKPALNEKHRRFVDEYLTDLNATQAAIRAGYSAKTAGAQSFALLQKPEIQKLLEERRADLQKRTEITQEMVLQRWWEIATADPNELISHRRVCCRNCFGKDHAYQWVDEAEWLSQVKMAKIMAGDKFKAEDAPTNEGGYGFDVTIRPHPKCPICKGEGHGQVFAHDTRDASASARALYAGVKQTKEGMEIKMRDQDAALANIARHLGMFNDKLKLQGDPENPLVALLQKVAGSALPIASAVPDDSDDE